MPTRQRGGAAQPPSCARRAPEATMAPDAASAASFSASLSSRIGAYLTHLAARTPTARRFSTFTVLTARFGRTAVQTPRAPVGATSSTSSPLYLPCRTNLLSQADGIFDRPPGPG